MHRLIPRIVFALVFLFSSTAGVAFAQTAVDVIEKHLAALGGRAALAKLTSRRSTGTVSVSTPAGEVSGSFESNLKAPNKSRIYMRLDLKPLGAPDDMTIEQKFDGTAGYVLNSMQGDVVIQGNQLENMRNNVFPSVLLSYKQAGVKVELLPNETVEGRPAVVLLVTPKTGSAPRIYLDAETYLVLRTVTKINSAEAGGDIEQIVTLSDYRVVDGVKVPFQIVNRNPLQTVAVKIAKVEHNVALDDAVFAKK
jgi:outer membrane lipoprotein-sorting protein